MDEKSFCSKNDRITVTVEGRKCSHRLRRCPPVYWAVYWTISQTLSQMSSPVAPKSTRGLLKLLLSKFISINKRERGSLRTKRRLGQRLMAPYYVLQMFGRPFSPSRPAGHCVRLPSHHACTASLASEAHRSAWTERIPHVIPLESPLESLLGRSKIRVMRSVGRCLLDDFF